MDIYTFNKLENSLDKNFFKKCKIYLVNSLAYLFDFHLTDYVSYFI